MNFQKLCVIGLGYIGLPTASTFAINGIKVLGVDVNPAVVETLQNGDIHIHEPGLRDIVTQAIQSGNFTASTKPEEADAFLIVLAGYAVYNLSFNWWALLLLGLSIVPFVYA